MNEYRKKMVLIPSAYNSRVMGDIENFIKFYVNCFDLYVIYDGKEKKINNVTYINKKKDYAKYLISVADYIIDAGTINGNSKISNSQKRISVWHGIPYKKMFIDLDEENIYDALSYGYGMNLMVSPSKFYTEKFLRNSMLYKGKVLETAISRTDSLYLENEDIIKLKKNLSIPLDKKILLYCPTYRVEGKFKLPFDSKKLIKSLNDNSNEEWVLLVKLHYLNKLDNRVTNVIDCTNYSSVNELFAMSDMLITDYSSLLFDYSLLNKPVVLYQYDQEEYLKDRGFMFDIADYIDKKYIISKEDELIEKLPKYIHDNNLSKIRNEFYPNQTKNSTEKLVKKLNLNANSRKTKDIIFLVNDLNQIGGVHNFILNLATVFRKKYNSKIFVFGINEFATTNDKNYVFDPDNIIDIKLSYENDSKKIINILSNTDGYIISCQFWAHKKMQNYLKGKNAILMFHGDTKDIVSKKLYKWHLDALNNRNLFNYKKLVLLTEGNCNLLKKSLIKEVANKAAFIENSFDFSDSKSLYKNNGEFALVSRLDSDKNIFDVLKIFSHSKINNNYKLHVYGDGKLKNEFIQKINDLKLQDKIIMHNYCDNKEEIFNNKQGLILPSLSEGFPLVIIEAVKYGIPIYAYNSFTAIEEFKNYSVIKLVETSNIDNFVDVLNYDTSFNEDDFVKIINRFSNDTIVKKWEKLFFDVENDICITSNKILSFKNIIKTLKTNITKGLKIILKRIYKKYFNNKFVKLKFKIYNIIISLKYYIFRIKNILKKSATPLVSIVVPFYNNNNTLDALLKSISKSGYSNYEVILVNDGSKEDPTDIYKKYKKINYFYKENEGLGFTRNFAIDKANGKYVFFIDSDDTMTKGALNFLVDYAERNKLSVVGGLCRKVGFDSKRMSFWHKEIYKSKYINNISNRYLLLYDTISTCKLYNVDDLRKSNIKFEKGLYEDKLYISKIYQYFDKIGIINNIVYNWYSYGLNTSITSTYSFDNISERIKRMNEIMNNSPEKFKVHYMSVSINHDLLIFINNYIFFKDADRKRIFDLYKDYFKKNINYIYEKNIKKIANKILINYIINNNFEDFDIIMTNTSKAVIKSNKNNLNN